MEFDEAVDRFGSSVGGSVGGPVGEEGVLPLAKSAAEAGDLRDRAGRQGRQYLLRSAAPGSQVFVVIIRLLGLEPPGLFLAARVLWMVVVFVFIGGAV